MFRRHCCVLGICSSIYITRSEQPLHRVPAVFHICVNWYPKVYRLWNVSPCKFFMYLEAVGINTGLVYFIFVYFSLFSFCGLWMQSDQRSCGPHISAWLATRQVWVLAVGAWCTAAMQWEGRCAFATLHGVCNSGLYLVVNDIVCRYPGANWSTV